MKKPITNILGATVAIVAFIFSDTWQYAWFVGGFIYGVFHSTLGDYEENGWQNPYKNKPESGPN